MKKGYDISRWQGDINWSQVDGDMFYIKASGGDAGLYQDPKLARNAALCPKPKGFYHFAGGTNPELEAKFFLSATKLYPSVFPHCLDWEPTQYNPTQALDFIHRFNHVIESETGRKILLYTGAYVSLKRDESLKQYDLWLAAYTPNPIPCMPWGLNWSLWQYTSRGNCPGIVGNVDTNQIQDSWFDKYVNPTPTPISGDEAHMGFFFQFPEGHVYTMTVSPQSDTGLAWVYLGSGTGPLIDGQNAGIFPVPGVWRELARGRDDLDALFERHPVLSGPHARTTHT